jgi:hypothetical protein
MTKHLGPILALAGLLLSGCVNIAEEPAPRQAAVVAAWYSGIAVNPDPYAGVKLNVFDMEESIKGMMPKFENKGRSPIGFSRTDDTSRIPYAFTAIESSGEGARLMRSAKRPWRSRTGDTIIFAPDDGGPVRFITKEANGTVATLPLEGKTILLITLNNWPDSELEHQAATIR